jgi:hypothetical protein
MQGSLNPDEVIRAHYGTATASEIAASLGPGWSAIRVRVKAQRLGVAAQRPAGDMKQWERNRETVRSMWATHRIIDIAEAVGKSIETVRAWSRSMQLPRKSETVPRGARSTPERRSAAAGTPLSSERVVETLRARWRLEQHLSEFERSKAVKCVCGQPGAPIHCHAHAKLFRRVLS